MKIEIKSRWDSSVLFSIEAGSIRLALEAAVKQGADLKGAYLEGAYLKGADLKGAYLEGADLEGAILETGETWKEYTEEVLPALFAAGGRRLAEVVTKEHWNCHQWDNCPMAAAFSVHDLEDIPALWRHRADQFIRLFDAKLIPWETVEPLLKAEAKSR